MTQSTARILASSALALVLFVGFSSTGHAYIDPGSGSMAVQLIIAGIASGLMSIKLFWGRIKGFFGGKSTEVSTGDDTDTTSDK